MPTQEQVLAAFDALGCGLSPSTALIKRLELEGFDPSSIPVAINEALASGLLVLEACVRKV